jgi:hypothetical protein
LNYNPAVPLLDQRHQGLFSSLIRDAASPAASTASPNEEIELLLDYGAGP